MRVDLSESLKLHPLFSEIKEDIETFYKNNAVNPVANLMFEDGALKLESDEFSKVFCDFNDKSFIREVRQSYGRSEGVYSFLKPLAKSGKLKICDMTVGMGKDFFKFILAGHKVVGFERNPVFYYLVKDGIERFLKSKDSEDLKKKFRVSEFSIELSLGEASINKDEKFDLVYYDPMFEDKSKKAAPKKGMQALKHIVEPSCEEDKIKALKNAISAEPRSLIFKCSGLSKGFPFLVKKEHKGKGFSYVYL